MTGKLPRIEVKPVVGNLDLVSIDNLLFEDTVPIPQTVTPRRVVQRREAVEETGSKPAQAPISKCGVVLLLNNIFDAEAEIGEAR